MHLWYTLFRHVDVLPGMPQISHVFCSRRGPGYCDRGRDRHDTGYAFQYTLRGEGVLSVRGRERRLPVGTGFFRRVDDPDLEHYLASDAEMDWEFVFCDLEAIGFSSMADAVIGRYGHVYELPPSHPFIQRL
ncbi:MAG: AraC family ligand binding domain-containing protein, partial [Planctomycetota bacterium]